MRSTNPGGDGLATSAASTAELSTTSTGSRTVAAGSNRRDDRARCCAACPDPCARQQINYGRMLGDPLELSESEVGQRYAGGGGARTKGAMHRFWNVADLDRLHGVMLADWV